MKKILITGVTGQLGYDVCLEIKKRYPDAEVLAPNRDYMDITNESNVNHIIKTFNPDVVFHCAAYTKVDKAEEEADICYDVNVNGTRNIVEACKGIGAKLVYVSTDYVFNGTKGSPYKENDQFCPLNVYGKTKLLGEKEVSKYNKSFIVRTSWVFGINGNNFVKKMLELAETEEELKIVSDQIGSPTYTVDLAKLLVDMAETDKYGVYHAHNEGYASWYEFANCIFESNEKDVVVKKIETVNYKQKAKRPLDNRLNTDKLEECGFKKLPHWYNALIRYNKELEIEKYKKMVNEFDQLSGVLKEEAIVFENKTKAIPTKLQDCYIIEPKLFGDDRGYFVPYFLQEYMSNLGFDKVIQTNRSLSGQNVLRGMHFQEEPYSQTKLVEVLNGAAVDVVTDIREGSPTYGQSLAILLIPYNPNIPGSGRQVFVPRGFAHAFVSLNSNTLFQYLIDNHYKPKKEGGILWNDDSVKAIWNEVFRICGIKEENLNLSEKDKVRPSLAESPTYFEYKKLELKKDVN